MGYDEDILVFKKKTLEKINEKYPNCSFKDIYSCYLFTRIYPDEYDFPEDEKATWIFSPKKDIFNEFFDGNFGDNEARIIDEETYFKFYNWLEEKLKGITLYDLTEIGVDKCYFDTLINTYKSMRNKTIDFETEFVVFQHDW